MASRTGTGAGTESRVPFVIPVEAPGVQLRGL